MEKKPLPERLESEHLLLRQHDPSFAALMFQYVDEDRERLRRFLPWVDATKGVADILDYIQRTQVGRAEGTLFDYGMFAPASGLYLGNAGVHALEWNHACCELGYWIRGEYEGQGHVTEAVRLLERACFHLGFHRVEIRCSSRNERSAAIPKRLGYSLEGTLRENAPELGRYRDTLVFGKLNPDHGCLP